MKDLNIRTAAAKVIKPLIVPVIILILWQIGGTQGWIKTAAISTPLKIGSKLLDLIADGTLQKNLFVSIRRIVLGYITGSFFGILLGILLGTFRTIREYMGLILTLFRPIPILVWVPVLILWIGIGENTKVILIAIGTFWPVFLNVEGGIANIDVKYLEVATIFGKSRPETIFQVILPGALPYLFSGLRIASGNALMAVIAAEMFAASSGLGYMVNFAREMNQPSTMMVGVLVIAILGALVNLVIQKFDGKR